MDRHHRNRTRGAQSTVAFYLVILIIVVSITQWLDLQSVVTRSLQNRFISHVYSGEFDCSLNCSQTSHPKPMITNNASSADACPEYFRWIHEDLSPWKNTGVTREMVEKAKGVAHVRIIVVKGRLYVDKYKKVFQTRDVGTLWGFLQLLRLYPGKVPDFDLMLECGDKPVIRKRDYRDVKNGLIPPLFHYSGDGYSYDIVLPDWSFWGWPEVNIKPWVELKEDIAEGNKRIHWRNREPYAYWKGNSKLGAARRDLVKCNASDKHDSKARIFGMDWHEEKKQGFKSSDLASQCTYRYKIYVEGVSWSVSQKYILACDSMTLIVKPRFHDFFTRSLLPMTHYWPINENNKCDSIKYAVEWGEKYADKAQEIGKAGSEFVRENLAMEKVYDYTFHLLNEYAKLLRYEPTVPRGAVEVCSETLVCSVRGQKRRFLKHSMVTDPSPRLPCGFTPFYELEALREFIGRKENLTKEVASWEMQQ